MEQQGEVRSNEPQQTRLLAYWLTFDDGKHACVEAENQRAAVEIGTEYRKIAVRFAQTLPYPAEPRIGPNASGPAFCYKPSECVGRTSCPQPYACTE